MPDVSLYFVSKNQHKQAEAQSILQPAGIEVLADHSEINELQTIDTDALVRDKALKAFKMIGRPLFVEHMGLYLDMLGGFPGGLTQIFWDSLKKDRFAQLFASDEDRSVAKTYEPLASLAKFLLELRVQANEIAAVSQAKRGRV